MRAGGEARCVGFGERVSGEISDCDTHRDLVRTIQRKWAVGCKGRGFLEIADLAGYRSAGQGDSNALTRECTRVHWLTEYDADRSWSCHVDRARQRGATQNLWRDSIL